MEKERKIIKTWTNSGKDTHQVFLTDKTALGYCEEDDVRYNWWCMHKQCLSYKVTTEFTDWSEFILNSDGVRVYLTVGEYTKYLEAMYLEDGKKQETLRQRRK